ncbi:hypothetical protein ACQPUI_04070 [Clostridium butyricum]|uniref:hypothetical protein n=1 Tax=Clostridium butyricum TaxID=1492 RepID=UPI003D358879
MERNRLERIVCERLVSNVCGGMEIVTKWGCLPDTDGYKYAEEIFDKKYTLITFSQLEKEILLTWYNELQYKQKMERKKSEDMDENEEYYLDNLFNKMGEWVVETTVEDKLNGIPNEMKENTERNSFIINRIDSTFNMIIDIARDKNHKGLINNNVVLQATNCIEELHKIKDRIFISKINDLDGYIKKSLQHDLGSYDGKANEEIIKRKYYFLSALFQISEDDSNFLDGYFKPINTKVLDNIFQSDNYNNEIENFLDKCFSERKNTLEYTMDFGKRKRNKTSETILEKAYKRLLDSISLKEFIERYIAFVDTYYSNANEIELKSIIDYYNIERRYNLKLHVTFIPVLIDYINITKDKREELLRRLSKLAMLDNCLFRHLKLEEVAEKIAGELEVDESKYYDSIVDEIKDIIGIKYYIVNQMLEIESLQYDNLENENIEEAIMSILNIDKDMLEGLTKIDFQDSDFLENNKIQNKIYKDIKSLLNMSKDIFMESNEYINL